VICSCVHEKVAHERGIPYKGDWIATEGVGYAHSTDDIKESTTLEEGRGIARIQVSNE
jgi:hypothetical protein